MALGQANPDAMLRSMSAATFAQWQAYYMLEPFGAEVEDVRYATKMSLWLAAHGGKGTAKQRMDAFRFGRSKPRGPQTHDEMLAVMKAAAGYTG